MTTVLLLIAATIFVAYANGSNDNFKGVATLYGSRTAGYWPALVWATVTTFTGSICSVFLADKLVKAFSGKGLLPDAVAGSPAFLAAVAIAAALTVLLATLTGFPISTTHALTGGMVGAGLVAAGRDLNFGVLGKTFFLPLLASPFLAIALGSFVYFIFRWVRLRLGITEEICVCVGETERIIPIPQPNSVMAMTAVKALGATVDTQAECTQRYQGHVLGVNVQSALDAGHYLSAGAVSFARGLNDTPKVVGLLFAMKALPVHISLGLIAAAMAIGGLLNARRVAETISRRITGMNHGQGFTANIVTALLVLTASRSGLPVSTTHVSCGSIFGIGLVTRQADTKVINQIVWSWVLTLPVAAVLAAAAKLLLH